MRKTIVSVLLAGTLAAGGAVALTASDSGAKTPTAKTSATTGTTKKHAHRHARRALRRAVVRISAKTIGVTPADLVSELKSGKSIADVANAHHVDPQKVVDALVKAGHDRVEKAVAAHKITRERANKIEARLPAIATKIVNKHRTPKS